MNPWPFVVAAYGLTIGGALMLILWAWLSARRAEARLDEVKRK